jgi:hypothetical protein
MVFVQGNESRFWKRIGDESPLLSQIRPVLGECAKAVRDRFNGRAASQMVAGILNGLENLTHRSHSPGQ